MILEIRFLLCKTWCWEQFAVNFFGTYAGHLMIVYNSQVQTFLPFVTCFILIGTLLELRQRDFNLLDLKLLRMETISFDI